MVGRNEQCDCGSGLKHKKCCGRPDKGLTQAGLLKAFQVLVKAADGLVISANEINMLPKDEVLAWHYDKDSDSFDFKSMVPEKRLIVEPSKRIITKGFLK